MVSYILNTESDKAQMLESIGVASISALFSDIPVALRLNRKLALEKPKSELEVSAALSGLAGMNESTASLTCFLGAGAYDHYIPSVVKHLISRSEFYTAYTPYQPEIAQGTLQGIFEYQSMITALTGMDVSNASLYDGASALAEAAMMAVDNTKRKKILVSKALHPESRAVLKTYLRFIQAEYAEIEAPQGVTDLEQLKAALDSQTAAVILQNPNFFGIIEDLAAFEPLIHGNKSLFITSVNPVSLGILTPPGETGSDIVVGEGQALGNPLNFGGPYLGFLAVKKALMRKIPGRICGLTNDIDGKRAFVLTLQAREQHIRRDKAVSNICSNQSLNAIAATIHLATLGKAGIREVAEQCLKKAHFTADALTQSGKFKLRYPQPFFHEFVLDLGEITPSKMNIHLHNHNILGGLDLGKCYPEAKHSMLLCVTEKRTEEEIKKLVISMEGCV